MDQKPVINYPSQFAFLLGLMGVCMVISAVMIGLIGTSVLHVPAGDLQKTLSLPENVNLSRLLNTAASFLCFFVPAFVLAKVLSKKPFKQLGFVSAISGKQIALILALTITGIMLSGALGQLNEWIPLPAQWWAKAKALEEEYKAAMMPMATMRSLSEYLLALLVLGAAPALFEEVLFRGGFQQVFVGWTKNKWVGIIITSILFSAIHFSYFGFLPRVGLGIVLGLIFYYSKSLWLNIFLHFLYNGLVVTQLYIMSQKEKPIGKTMDENMPMWWGLVALVVLVALFRSFKKESASVLAKRELSIHSSPENIFS
ncbi:MAG: CPBP family intramembrane glutamic endopeptidase [Bacteroidota bacterium]